MRPLHAPEPADLESWQSAWLWSCWTLCVPLGSPFSPCVACVILWDCGWQNSLSFSPFVGCVPGGAFLVQYKWFLGGFLLRFASDSSATTALCGASKPSANGYSFLVCVCMCVRAWLSIRGARQLLDVWCSSCQGLVVAQGVCCLLGPTQEGWAPSVGFPGAAPPGGGGPRGGSQARGPSCCRSTASGGPCSSCAGQSGGAAAIPP